MDAYESNGSDHASANSGCTLSKLTMSSKEDPAAASYSRTSGRAST